MPYPAPLNLANYKLNTVFTDIASAQDVYIPIGGVGRVLGIYIAPHAALTGASTVITPFVNTTQMQLNGSNQTLTMAVGSAGQVYSLDLGTGTNRVNAGDVIRLSSDGGATNAGAVPATVTVLLSTIN